MDLKKRKMLNDNISNNRSKLLKETNEDKKRILRLKINIDEIKLRIERNKK